jgi:GT2 family glycosyltransferase
VGQVGERLTVVIATRNRRGELLRTLARLRSLPERPQIVVVDNGSTDGTAHALRALQPGVCLLQLDRDHGSAGRNAGVRRAHTPYVAFCDDDSWWEPGALAGAVLLLDRHPQVGLLAARVEVGRGRRLDPICAAMRSSPLSSDTRVHPGRAVLGFLACAAVTRRDAFLSVGGFHPRFGIGGEEQLLAVDLAAKGWSVAYVDELLVHHHPSSKRNRNERRIAMERNALWFYWLRRPLSTALRRTLGTAGRARADRDLQRAVWAAMRGAPWVLRSRHTLPPAVERDVRLLLEA